ncbi:hypothetical protein HK098_006233 [Nowakowskiella sp. JEL0407]|nr:hypothetical protein HK098_006233 [Nowakowskiella sp. JEL0407]
MLCNLLLASHSTPAHSHAHSSSHSYSLSSYSLLALDLLSLHSPLDSLHARPLSLAVVLSPTLAPTYNSVSFPRNNDPPRSVPPQQDDNDLDLLLLGRVDDLLFDTFYNNSPSFPDSLSPVAVSPLFSSIATPSPFPTVTTTTTTTTTTTATATTFSTGAPTAINAFDPSPHPLNNQDTLNFIPSSWLPVPLPVLSTFNYEGMYLPSPLSPISSSTFSSDFSSDNEDSDDSDSVSSKMQLDSESPATTLNNLLNSSPESNILPPKKIQRQKNKHSLISALINHLWLRLLFTDRNALFPFTLNPHHSSSNDCLLGCTLQDLFSFKFSHRADNNLHTTMADSDDNEIRGPLSLSEYTDLSTPSAAAHSTFKSKKFNIRKQKSQIDEWLERLDSNCKVLVQCKSDDSNTRCISVDIEALEFWPQFNFYPLSGIKQDLKMLVIHQSSAPDDNNDESPISPSLITLAEISEWTQNVEYTFRSSNFGSLTITIVPTTTTQTNIFETLSTLENFHYIIVFNPLSRDGRNNVDFFSHSDFYYTAINNNPETYQQQQQQQSPRHANIFIFKQIPKTQLFCVAIYNHACSSTSFSFNNTSSSSSSLTKTAMTTIPTTPPLPPCFILQHEPAKIKFNVDGRVLKWRERIMYLFIYEFFNFGEEEEQVITGSERLLLCVYKDDCGMIQNVVVVDGESRVEKLWNLVFSGLSKVDKWRIVVCKIGVLTKSDCEDWNRLIPLPENIISMSLFSNINAPIFQVFDSPFTDAANNPQQHQNLTPYLYILNHRRPVLSHIDAKPGSSSTDSIVPLITGWIISDQNREYERGRKLSEFSIFSHFERVGGNTQREYEWGWKDGLVSEVIDVWGFKGISSYEESNKSGTVYPNLVNVMRDGMKGMYRLGQPHTLFE